MQPLKSIPKVKVLEEFKGFLLKTNALALAIGVIIGAATGKLVGSLVNDMLMPVIGRITGGVDFSNLYLNLTPSVKFENYTKAKEAGAAFGYGVFINNLIDFAIISFVVFMITKAILKEKPASPAPPGPETKTCRDCGESVLKVARKCKWCGSALSEQ